MDPLSPLKKTAERLTTDNRRRPTAHPWAEAYLRAHGIEDAGLRAEILAAVLARTARRRAENKRPEDESELVMEETSDSSTRQLALVRRPRAGPASRRRAAGLLAGGRSRAGPAALLDAARAPAALRFQMRTARIPRMRRSRAQMARGARGPRDGSAGASRPQRWLSFALCVLSLMMVTCHG